MDKEKLIKLAEDLYQSAFDAKGYDTACADNFKSKEVYQSGY